MIADFPTAPSAYGLNGPSAAVTVEKSIQASHTEILAPRGITPPQTTTDHGRLTLLLLLPNSGGITGLLWSGGLC